MFNDLPEGQTHACCQNRLAKEGGKAKCCDCHPHEDCNMDSPEADNLARMKPSERIEEAIIHGGGGLIQEVISLKLSICAELDRIQEELNELKKKV